MQLDQDIPRAMLDLGPSGRAGLGQSVKLRKYQTNFKLGVQLWLIYPHRIAAFIRSHRLPFVTTVTSIRKVTRAYWNA